MKNLQTLATELGEVLVTRGLTLAAAESCTGGWLAQTATGVVGSSAWFDRGFVVYSYASKCEMLGLDSEFLERHGAVSQGCVEAMAKAALARSNADVAIAISGVAGPSGGTLEKPVGLVWMACASPESRVTSRVHQFDGDRNCIRAQSVALALRLVVEVLAARDDRAGP